MADPSPRDAADLDTTTLLSLAGSAADAAVMTAMREQGFSVTRAHGYVFQRLLTGEQSITDLARDLRMTQQGASKHVAELERLGLVSRTVRPDDRRARVVALTDRGRESIDVARAARADLDRRLQELVGEGGHRALREALVSLLDGLGISRHIASRSIPIDE
jgi:DNA-binding MarR family transcriptional regulator